MDKSGDSQCTSWSHPPQRCFRPSRTKIIIYIHAICFGSKGITGICEVTLNVATLPSNLCTSGRSSACVWFICRFGISHNHPILEIVVSSIWQYQKSFDNTKYNFKDHSHCLATWSPWVWFSKCRLLVQLRTFSKENLNNGQKFSLEWAVNEVSGLVPYPW